MMPQLFIELYLDEDVDVLVAELLRGRGFDVLTTRQADCLGESDEEQLAFAVRHERKLVTHNRADFEELAQKYIVTEREHYGIILATRRQPYEIVRRLLTILNHVTADEIKNQLRYI